MIELIKVFRMHPLACNLRKSFTIFTMLTKNMHLNQKLDCYIYKKNLTRRYISVLMKIYERIMID